MQSLPIIEKDMWISLMGHEKKWFLSKDSRKNSNFIKLFGEIWVFKFTVTEFTFETEFTVNFRIFSFYLG